MGTASPTADERLSRTSRACSQSPTCATAFRLFFAFVRPLATIGSIESSFLGRDGLIVCRSRLSEYAVHFTKIEAKIERALERGTDRRVPIVRAVRRAYTLATEYPRRNLVIALERQRRRRRR
jgi:hypothetical protein